MTKPKYATAEERRKALSEKARRQMLAQWEAKRQEDGSELGYFGAHRRVRKVRGRAADQACEHCGGRARHWAHVHDSDPAVPANYIPLCQSCHWVYDDIAARGQATKGPEGRSAEAKLRWARRSPEERRAILEKAWRTRRERAAALVVAVDAPYHRR